MNSVFNNSILDKTFRKTSVWYKYSHLFSLSQNLKKNYAVSTHENYASQVLRSTELRSNLSLRTLMRSHICNAFVSCACHFKQLFNHTCLKFASYIKNLSANSKIGFLLKKLTLRRFIIAGFALSVFADYFFRNIAKLAMVASVWDEFLMLAAFCYLLYRRASSGLPKLCRVTPIDGYLLLFFGIGFFLMCVISPYPAVAFAGYRAVVEYMLWFFLMIRLVENDGDFMTFYYTLVLLGIFMALHGVYQYIVAAPIPAGWVSKTETGVRTRVFSIVGSPNILGSFFVLTAPMAAALAYYFKDIRLKITAWCAVCVMCFSLLFTFSRAHGSA